MLVSIVTVTRDDPAGVSNTVSSVISQDYKSWELLICDGGSSADNITKLERICLGDPRVSIVSYADSGIFDAMNKGASCASGDYLIFLNGGDCFYDPLVLTDFVRAGFDEIDFICGDVTCADMGRELAKNRSGIECFSYIHTGRIPPHQGIFIDRLFFNKLGGYNTCYRIVGDFDLYLRIRKMRARMIHWRRRVSIFDLGGVSSTANWAQERERFISFKSNYGFFTAVFYLPYFLIRLLKGEGRMILTRLGVMKKFRRFH